MVELRRGSNLRKVRSGNLSVVLEAIRRVGPLSRVELTALTGLTPSTITNLVGELISYNLVYESGSAPSKGGRRRVLITLSRNAYWVGAMALRPGWVHAALLDMEAKTVAQCTERLRWGGVSEVVAGCRRAGACLLQRAQELGQQVMGFGLAVAEGGDAAGAWLMEDDHLLLQDALATAFGVPVRIEEQPRASALGEAWFGAGREADSLVFMSVDRQVRAGVVIDGRLYRGAQGRAGRLGDAESLLGPISPLFVVSSRVTMFVLAVTYHITPYAKC